MKASEEKKRPWFDRKNIITIICVSISLSFTVFFFSPIDIFLGNQREFSINAYCIIIPLLLLAAAGSAALMLIMSLSLLNRTVYNVVTSILFGLIPAFFVQMMLFNGNLKILDGDDGFLLYTQATPFNIFNAVVMYVIIVSPLVMTFLREKDPGGKGITGIARGKAAAYLSVMIFVMELCGSAGMLISNGLVNTSREQYIYCFSLEPFMSVSEEENITVFLLDMLDGKWMNETLERYPEMNERLEGFTFYHNNISRYNYTIPSVACMLTNAEHNSNEDQYQFLDRAWEEGSLPRTLSENGYRTNLLTAYQQSFNEFSQISECSNIVPVEIGSYRVNYMGKYGIVDTMVNLSLTKLVPYFFKSFFVLRTADVIGDDFLIFKAEIPDGLVQSVSPETDVLINEYFSGNQLRTDSEEKTFSFIHLYGAHGSSEEVSCLYPAYREDPSPYNMYTTIRGDFESLFTYFDMMKELGVYDDSTIIIIADHQQPSSVSTASLLIKPKGAERIPLQHNSEAELSNEYFFPSILEYAGIDHSEYGYSYNDIIMSGNYPERYITFNPMFADRKLYRVTGDAGDGSNWEEIPFE